MSELKLSPRRMSKASMVSNITVKRKRAAIFGAGRIGRVHFRSCYLNSRVEVAWLVEAESNLQAAKFLLEQYDMSEKVSILSFDESEAVFKDRSVDFVMVCTPSYTHEAIVLKALEAGKAVFCEKPLAFTLDGILKCYDKSEEKGKPLYCAFQRRFDPNIRRIYKKIRSGDLGSVRTLRTISRDPAHMTNLEYLKSAGGILLDSCIHDLDIVCWLANAGVAPTMNASNTSTATFNSSARSRSSSPTPSCHSPLPQMLWESAVPVTVFAAGHAHSDKFRLAKDVSAVMIVVTFSTGVLAQVEVCRDSPTNYDQRVEVMCEKGLLQSQNHSQTNTVLTTPEGATVDPYHDDCCGRYMDAYLLELEHFVDVLEGSAQLEVTSQSVIKVIKVVRACQESLKTGQAVRVE